MADNRLFSPPGVVAIGNALSSRMSRLNLSCVDHEESSGTKQRLRKYTMHSEPLIELSNQRKHKEHVYFYFNFKLIGSKK